MLTQLYIQNIAVIEQASIDFEPGFTVLTGETGAGKSIIIDAIYAVLGERTSKELVRTGAEQASVSALFTDVSPQTQQVLRELDIPLEDDGSLLIRREIRPHGRSSCKLNNIPATVSMLRAVGGTLIDILGQHESYKLLSPEVHGTYIDSFAGAYGLLAEYRAAYTALRRIKGELDALESDEGQKSRRMDILRYQIEELEEALEGADLILGGVSSFGLDWFCDEILPVLPEDVPLLTVTKGMVDLDDGTLVPYPHIFEQRQPEGKHINFNAIGGPCTSYELADHDDSHVAFCGKDMETLKFIKSLLTTDYYHISLSTDVVGVECAVAMKNAYALGVSLAVGLAEKRDGEIGAVHYNSQAALFGQGVKEMIHLLELIHGGPENIIHGAGDLYVTVFGGRTRKIGTLLGRGLTFDQAMEELQGVTLESIVIATRTARAVRKLAERGVVSLDDFPLLMHVDAIINEGAEVNIPWEKFTTVVE